MNRQETGAYSELVACAWLLTQGYEVFRNVCPTGPTDLVAIKGGVVERFDVKTEKFKVESYALTVKQQALGVKVLVVHRDGTCRVAVTSPIVQGEHCCEGCGRTYRRLRQYQRFCTSRCRERASNARRADGYMARDVLCAVCGAAYQQRKPWQQFCSSRCKRLRHYREERCLVVEGAAA